MDAVEDVKSRLSIEDVVADYVQLKRSGRNFKGLSPWTNEKTASLMVSPEKQIWHDFSSGKGGNIFSFVMEMEGVEFRQALELLARKAGVDLDQYDKRPREQGNYKERLHKANELAAKYYQLQLKSSTEALEYLLKKRGLSKKTVLDFQLGYAPEQGNGLRDLLVKNGFTQKDLQQAGLLSRSVSDMFRGRIMIPLADQQGRVIGFTGRLLKDANGPKYLNTPATAIYDKSRHVYGLHLAKTSIRKNDFVVVVEGNMDVIASHQADVTNVVASAGTAMTEYHLKTLGRFTSDVRLAFDQDQAGITATERIIPLAQKTNTSVSIITIDGAKDPDELVQKDPALWQQAITKKHDVIDWLISVHQKQADLNSYAGREVFKKAILSAISQLKSRGEQQRYAGKVAALLGYSKTAVVEELETMGKVTHESKLRSNKVVPIKPEQVEYKKLQDHLLTLIMHNPDLRGYLHTVTPEMLLDDPAKALLKILKKNDSLVEVQNWQNTEEYGKILDLEYDEIYRGLELTELHYEAARLQTRLIEHYVKRQKAEIRQKLASADDAATTQLLEQARQLDQLLTESQRSAA